MGWGRVSRFTETNWSFLSSRKKTRCFAYHEGKRNLFTGKFRINAILEVNLCPKNNFALQEIERKTRHTGDCDRRILSRSCNVCYVMTASKMIE